MKIKTSVLIGPTLDWAVARSCSEADSWPRWDPTGMFSPSTDWYVGGQIIEREIGNIYIDHSGDYYSHNKAGTAVGKGPTPLIAAMRCFVASKLGDEVAVPKELLK